MKLRLISEIQYKESSTNMLRKNLSTQYGATDFNDNLHQQSRDPRRKERARQQSLQRQYQAIKAKRSQRSSDR